MTRTRLTTCGLASISLSVIMGSLSAQTIQAPFNGVYSFTSLGTVTGVPTPYGGVTFMPGDPNTMLLGGSANNSAGAIYSVPVTRDPTGRMTGFGTPTLFSTAPNIDGGLSFGPGGVLFFTRYSTNDIISSEDEFRGRRRR